MVEEGTKRVRIGNERLKTFSVRARSSLSVLETQEVSSRARWTSGRSTPVSNLPRSTPEPGQATGKLSEVMKESAEIAYSYVVASPGVRLRTIFDMSMVHLRAEGATPKDGPVPATMATALVSLARGACLGSGRRAGDAPDRCWRWAVFAKK